MEKEKVLGIDVCITTYEELRNAIKNDIEQNRKSYIVTINPEKVIKAKKDKSLKEILNTRWNRNYLCIKNKKKEK